MCICTIRSSNLYQASLRQNIFVKIFLANDVDPVDLQCDDEPTEWQ